MQIAKQCTKRYKNGLTPDQVTTAREILAKVTVTELAKRSGVKYYTIWNVLRDANGNVAALAKALDTAKEMIKEKERVLASIPSC